MLSPRFRWRCCREWKRQSREWKLQTGTQQLRHLPQLQCGLWSLGSILVTVAESPVGACWELSIVEPRKPHLLSGTDHNSGSGIEGVGLAGSSEFRFFKQVLGLGCGRCISILESSD